MTADPTATHPTRDTLRKQTPAALLMVGALAALFVVNAPQRAPALVQMQPVSPCEQCGEVIAVRPITASKFGEPAAARGGLALDVRMQDGSLRTIKHDTGEVRIGSRVHVGGDVLDQRS